MARAHRLSFVGELGWELYVPVDMARQRLRHAACRAARTSACGSAAPTRSTAAVWRRPIATTATTWPRPTTCWKPASASPSSPTRPGAASAIFIGREAVLRMRQAGLSRRLVQFLLADPRPLLYGNEAILRDGRVVGYLTSGAYGHHLGAAVGLGYVACSPGEGAAELLASTYAIEVAGEPVPRAPASTRSTIPRAHACAGRGAKASCASPLPCEGGGRRGHDLRLAARLARELQGMIPRSLSHLARLVRGDSRALTPTRNAIGLRRPTACVAPVADGRLSPWRSVRPPSGGGGSSILQTGRAPCSCCGGSGVSIARMRARAGRTSCTTG